MEYDPSVDDPSHAVIAAVSSVSQSNPIELDTLYSVIDPDALNKLCSSNSDTTCHLTFGFAGYQITVDATGKVVLKSEDCSTDSNG
ncbi:HalOD1 output domain-containing protein [Natronoglomus mannanivorans]|uniref:HalOD1 output domain-containing protein n=1 Tax=Natronoglomus mannanivorans TaxID=2979990 RepID=UPI003CCCD4D1